MLKLPNLGYRRNFSRQGQLMECLKVAESVEVVQLLRLEGIGSDFGRVRLGNGCAGR